MIGYVSAVTLRDGVYVPVDVTEPCGNCRGWTRYEGDGKHCFLCGGSGRVKALWASVAIPGDEVSDEGVLGIIEHITMAGEALMDWLDDAGDNPSYFPISDLSLIVSLGMRPGYRSELRWNGE